MCKWYSWALGDDLRCTPPYGGGWHCFFWAGSKKLGGVEKAWGSEVWVLENDGLH